MSDLASNRVRDLNKEREIELKQNIMGSMHPGPIPAPFGGMVSAATGFSIFPEAITNEDDKSTALAMAGMLDGKNLGPIGAGANVLGAGLVEAFKAYPFRQRLAEARQPTDEDRKHCESLAGQRGL